MTVQSLTPDLEEYFGATNGGVLVSSVARDSAAAKAGIKAGDVITSINGDRVVGRRRPDAQLDVATGEVTIVVLRDKKEMTLKATIDGPKGVAARAVRSLCKSRVTSSASAAASMGFDR